MDGLQLVAYVEHQKKLFELAKETLGKKAIEEFPDNREFHKVVGNYVLANQTQPIRICLGHQSAECNFRATNIREGEDKIAPYTNFAMMAENIERNGDQNTRKTFAEFVAEEHIQRELDDSRAVVAAKREAEGLLEGEQSAEKKAKQ